MKRKSIVILALFILLLGILPVNVFAYTPPAGFGAPEGFAVILGDYQDTLPDFTGFDTTASVPADIRSLIDQADDSASDFNTSGNYNLFVLMQLDFKTDTGAWHYSSDWDSGDKLNDQDFTKNFGVGKGFYTASTDFGTDEYFNKYFSSETPSVKSYFDSHTWQFRSRFVVKYSGPSGEYVSLTPWSSVVSYSNKPAADPDKLINHAPVLKSAKLGTYANGQPYMTVITDKPNSQVEELASISGNWVRTEIWLKVGTDDWKLARESEFKEQLTFDAVDYFGELANYNDTAFDVKVRYSFDYYNYPQAGKSGKIYSPFSNVISKNLGAWSNASTWATPELQKASDAGLIPAILIGADMTKPITREEFCELSVLLYEKVTGKAATAAEPNPFNDTTNPQILKAYKLGITQGTSAITFSPKTLINREQCAAMLFRAIKVIKPSADYAVTDVKNFPDHKYISSYAVAAAKYMSKIGIIKGDSSGNFMPKAVTSAQTAAGYGMAAREAAILMTVRTYDNMSKAGTGTSTSSSGTTSTTASSPAAATVSATAAPASVAGLAGLWSYQGTNGTLVDPSTGYATGSIYNGEWYLFRDDGTFRYVLVSSGQFVSGGVVQEGSYAVSGGTATLSGVTESWYPNPAATGQKASYEHKSVSGRTISFILKDNGSTLVVDGTDTFTRS